jgi:hypothetical protein
MLQQNVTLRSRLLEYGVDDAHRHPSTAPFYRRQSLGALLPDPADSARTAPGSPGLSRTPRLSAGHRDGRRRVGPPRASPGFRPMPTHAAVATTAQDY